MYRLLVCMAIVAMAQAMSNKEMADEFCTMRLVVSQEQQTALKAGYFTDPLDPCHYYIICYYEPFVQAHRMRLPPGVWFDEDINGISMIPDHSLCNRADACWYKDLNSYGFYKTRQGDCGVYTKCVDGVAEEMCCMDGTVFNMANRACEMSSDKCVSTKCVRVVEPVEPEESEEPEEPVEPAQEVLPIIIEKGRVYTCMQGDVKIQIIDGKKYTHISLDGTTRGEDVCPAITPYFSYLQCSCVTKEGLKLPEKPELEAEVLPIIIEKGKVYKCMQGDYEFHLLDGKKYIRTSLDGVMVPSACTEETPYFSIRQCTCVTIEVIEIPERGSDKSRSLEVNQCYSFLDKVVYEKVGINTYIVAENERSGGSKSRSHSRKSKSKTSHNKSKKGSHGSDGEERIMMTCPYDKLMFNLQVCACDIFMTAIEVPQLPEIIIPEIKVPKLRLPWFCNRYDMDFDRRGSFMSRFGDFESHTKDVCFDGSIKNYIEIPNYRGNWFGKELTLAMKYKFTERQGTEEFEPLIQSGSKFGIYIKRGQVKFVISTDTVQCEVLADVPALRMSRAYRAKMPYVTIMAQYDGERMSLKLIGNTPTGISNSAVCSGTIGSTPDPFKVGSTFKGCIDELYVCKGTYDPLPLE